MPAGIISPFDATRLPIQTADGTSLPQAPPQRTLDAALTQRLWTPELAGHLHFQTSKFEQVWTIDLLQNDLVGCDMVVP
jgi:hypothetical protein